MKTSLAIISSISGALLALSLLNACAEDNAVNSSRYVIGGKVIGLNGKITLDLQKNGQIWESTTLEGENGDIRFNFTDAFASGTEFTISIRHQPVQQECDISLGNGILTASTAQVSLIYCLADTVSWSQADIEAIATPNQVSKLNIAPSRSSRVLLSSR